MSTLKKDSFNRKWQNQAQQATAIYCCWVWGKKMQTNNKRDKKLTTEQIHEWKERHGGENADKYTPTSSRFGHITQFVHYWWICCCLTHISSLILVSWWAYWYCLFFRSRPSTHVFAACCVIDILNSVGLYFKDIYSKHHLIHTVFLLFSLPLVSPEQSFTMSYFPHVKCVFAAVNILSSLFLCGLAPSTPQSTSWRSNWSPTTPASSTSRRTLPLLR